MAQTKRKRQTKHRGNAAGMVETRGRTGRKPNADEKKPDAKQARLDKLNQPPTWRGAIIRSAIATAIFVAVVLLAGLATLIGWVWTLLRPLYAGRAAVAPRLWAT